MKLDRLAIFFALSALTLSTVACSGTPATPPGKAPGAEQAKADEDEDEASVAPEHDRFLLLAKGLDLSDAQKTQLRGIADDVRGKGTEVRNARKELLLAVATAVEKSNFDDPAVGAKLALLTEAVTKHQRDIADSMNKVHGTLTAAQRQKIAERIAHGPLGRGPFGAEGPRGKPHDMREHGEHERHGHGRDALKGLKELADRLELTAKQREQLRDAMRASVKAKMEERKDLRAKGQAMRDKAKRVSEAFAGDRFDAVALGVGDHASEAAKAMAEHRIEMAKILMAELTPEQRAKFAAVLRERAQKARF